MIPATEGVAYLRKAVMREFFRERHGDLSWPRQRSVAFLAQKIRHSNLEIICDRLLDVLYTDLTRLDRYQISQSILCLLNRDFATSELGVRDNAPECSLKLSNI